LVPETLVPDISVSARDISAETWVPDADAGTRDLSPALVPERWCLTPAHVVPDVGVRDLSPALVPET
jgi:hypothetical protein